MSVRSVALVAAAGALALVWLFPFAAHGVGPFTAHMLRHATLVAVASALFALALPRLARVAPSPLPASALELVVVWGFHVPILHRLARASGAGFAVEQLAFLLAGLAVWSSALRPGQGLAGAGALLLTSMHMTLLGALIVLAPAPLYHHGAGDAASGAAALADQRLGGIAMLAIGTPIYLAAGLALVGAALREERPAGEDGIGGDAAHATVATAGSGTKAGTGGERDR